MSDAKNSRAQARSGFGIWLDQHLYSFVSSLGRTVRRPWATLLTIGVMAVAFVLPLGLWLALQNVGHFAGDVQQSREIDLFLTPETPVARAQALAEALRARDDVARVELRTPEQGLAEFRQRSGLADSLNLLDGNPLPSLLVVVPQGDEARLVTALEALPETDLLQHDAAWRERLTGWMGFGERLTWVLAALFGIAGACWMIASVAIWVIREEPGATEGGANAGVEALKSLKLLRDDKPFRNFVIVRTLLLSVSLGSPMLIILAQNALGNAALIGLFLIVSGLANTVSGYLWGRLADYSSRILMAISSGINALVGIAVLMVLQSEADVSALLLFVVAYFLASVCLAGVRLGRKTLLVDMGNQETRSAYVAVSNTAIGILILLMGALVSLVAGQDTRIMLWIFSGLSAAACVLCPLLLPARRGKQHSN